MTLVNNLGNRCHALSVVAILIVPVGCLVPLVHITRGGQGGSLGFDGSEYSDGYGTWCTQFTLIARVNPILRPPTGV